MSNIDVQEIRERVQTLIIEIRQIHEQYKIEVPKKRRPWPKSIQERILELWRLGVSSHQIALETGLPAQTLYSWRQRLKKSEPGFLQVTPKPVQKRHRRSNFNLQLSQLEVKDKATTVTVITSDGLRVEGVPIESAADLVRRIGKS